MIETLFNIFMVIFMLPYLSIGIVQFSIDVLIEVGIIGWDYYNEE